MEHLALMTFAFDQGAEHVTITITCNQDDGCTFVIPTAHIAPLAQALVGLGAAAGFDLSRAAHVIDLGTAENRQRAEHTYAEYITRQRAALTD